VVRMTAEQQAAEQAVIAEQGRPLHSEPYQRADGRVNVVMYYTQNTVIVEEDGTVGYDSPGDWA
jgi:hypothetical protein